MHPVVRFLIVAVLIWLIPFLVSLPFFNRTGQLQADFWLFKSIMALMLSGSAFILFRWLVRRWSPRPNPATMALLGLGAVLVSVALDTVTVLPLTKMGLGTYVVQVASFYLLIIVMSVAAGANQSKREDPHAIA